MFKSAEEREAELREREAARARAEEEQRRQEFLASPIGAATAAKEAGQRFFEIQLEVGAHHGTAGFGSAEGRRTTASSAEVLSEIEQLGWRLEHVGYVYMVTGETSTERVFLSGAATAVSGVTVGVYLFRSATEGTPV